MIPSQWTQELSEWASLATVLGAFFGILGLGTIVAQLWSQQQQSRLQAFEAFVSELDTHEARMARKRIIEASDDELRLTHLNSVRGDQLRRDVDNTLATLEHMAYKINTKQIPEPDAFNYYGGVLLAMANRLWPYVEDHRAARLQNPRSHKLIYRRYLEERVVKWIPRYCKEGSVNKQPPPTQLSTREKLAYIFETKPQ